MSTLRNDSFVNAQQLKGVRVLEIPQLSDTRWVCRYVAVELFQTRNDCLLDALYDIQNCRDRSAAAESQGLIMQLEEFSFIVYLCIFEEILGLTKPWSDHLQAKELDLSCAMDLVESITKTFKAYRVDGHFSSTVWKRAKELAVDREIDICTPESHRRKSAHLNDGVVLASTYRLPLFRVGE